MKQLAVDLVSLNKAVHDALERKQRLEQYAVVWRDGRPQRVEPSATRTRAWTRLHPMTVTGEIGMRQRR